MFLLIDFGNTRIKAFIRDKAQFRKALNISSKAINAADQLKAFIQKYAIEKCIYSTVIRISDDIQEFLDQLPAQNINQLEPYYPFKIEYESRETLGQDRLAAVCGAITLFPEKNILIIQAGTAITYDYVVSKHYLGGAISPGFKMRLIALHTFTDKLPLIETDFFDRMIGKNTGESLLSGTFKGIESEISTRISEFIYNFGDSIAIITGGDAQYFVNCVKNSIFAVENLTETGLFYLVNQTE